MGRGAADLCISWAGGSGFRGAHSGPLTARRGSRAGAGIDQGSGDPDARACAHPCPRTGPCGAGGRRGAAGPAPSTGRASVQSNCARRRAIGRSAPVRLGSRLDGGAARRRPHARRRGGGETRQGRPVGLLGAPGRVFRRAGRNPRPRPLPHPADPARRPDRRARAGPGFGVPGPNRSRPRPPGATAPACRRTPGAGTPNSPPPHPAFAPQACVDGSAVLRLLEQHRVAKHSQVFGRHVVILVVSPGLVQVRARRGDRRRGRGYRRCDPDPLPGTEKLEDVKDDPPQ